MELSHERLQTEHRQRKEAIDSLETEKLQMHKSGNTDLDELRNQLHGKQEEIVKHLEMIR